MGGGRGGGLEPVPRLMYEYMDEVTNSAYRMGGGSKILQKMGTYFVDDPIQDFGFGFRMVHQSSSFFLITG